MIDTASIPRTYLLTVAGLTSLVSSRVVVLPINKDDLLPAVGYRRMGGNFHARQDLARINYWFECWADSALEASNVHKALHDGLRAIYNSTVGSNRIDYATELIGAQDMVDLESEKPYVSCMWALGIR